MIQNQRKTQIPYLTTVRFKRVNSRARNLYRLKELRSLIGRKWRTWIGGEYCQ